MRVEVLIQLKPGILDPQGEALGHALEALGHDDVRDIRVGKWITFDLGEDGGSGVEERVRDMCERLLANPVIERYEYRLSPNGAA